MNLLAIDTSAAACSLALQTGETVQVQHRHLPLQQAAQILPLLNALLQSAGLSPADLDAVAFGQGPGSFTGLRIAASVAKALAFAAGVPVIPVSSLAVLAAGIVSPASLRLVAVDARMDEIYWAAFETTPAGLVRLTPDSLCRPEALPPQRGEWQGVGNAWQVYADRMGYRPACIEADSSPAALAMLPLARAALAAGQTVPAAMATPLYLRDKVTFSQSALDSPPQGR